MGTHTDSRDFWGPDLKERRGVNMIEIIDSPLHAWLPAQHYLRRLTGGGTSGPAHGCHPNVCVSQCICATFSVAAPPFIYQGLTDCDLTGSSRAVGSSSRRRTAAMSPSLSSFPREDRSRVLSKTGSLLPTGCRVQGLVGGGGLSISVQYSNHTGIPVLYCTYLYWPTREHPWGAVASDFRRAISHIPVRNNAFACMVAPCIACTQSTHMPLPAALHLSRATSCASRIVPLPDGRMSPPSEPDARMQRATPMPGLGLGPIPTPVM